ncbi:Vacuolar protein sorting-associated protein [Echinococcus granulosus]|uniref:Anaphase-promoting complex subunit 2 n=1 Tax=Echinococcus granulosus TaxID=6210 RepID=W6UCD3_ECHGR|nr:Vacuolar protein sorting-associated protein [Echinococcus granulosus]EUB58915.1 Vacuolar protein sorting-associated protein [Echinococcus granulosus]
MYTQVQASLRSNRRSLQGDPMRASQPASAPAPVPPRPQPQVQYQQQAPTPKPRPPPQPQQPPMQPLQQTMVQQPPAPQTHAQAPTPPPPPQQQQAPAAPEPVKPQYGLGAQAIMKKSPDFSMTDTVVVPKETDITPLGHIPLDQLETRTVRIYMPSKSATQSGTFGCNKWRIEVDNLGRWENPLMGWASTGDPLSNFSMDFHDVESAIAYCKSQCWNYFIENPKKTTVKPKSYAANFSWDKQVLIMLNSVTMTRSRRPNAGSRMARLLNEEEEDDFYTNAYGGFAEEENDNDYESESSGHDSIDTDFADSEEEDDEDEGSGGEAMDDEKRKRRTRRVVTKSYKEPKTKKEVNEKITPESKSRIKTAVPAEETLTETIAESRKLRASTVRATETAAQRREASSVNAEVTAVKRKALMAEIAQRKNLPEVRRLTQEELLAEAKITEEINKRSLARYQRMEVERKKIRVQKTVSQQPMIRTHSFTVPCLADQPEVYDVSVNPDKEVEMRRMLVERNARCARTLVSFADEASFAAAFPSYAATTTSGKRTDSTSSPSRKRQMHHCPLTGRVARYLDPLTRTPYADLAAFRALRHLYRLHLETGASAVDLLRRFRSDVFPKLRGKTSRRRISTTFNPRIRVVVDETFCSHGTSNLQSRMLASELHELIQSGLHIEYPSVFVDCALHHLRSNCTPAFGEIKTDYQTAASMDPFEHAVCMLSDHLPAFIRLFQWFHLVQVNTQSLYNLIAHHLPPSPHLSHFKVAVVGGVFTPDVYRTLKPYLYAYLLLELNAAEQVASQYNCFEDSSVTARLLARLSTAAIDLEEQCRGVFATEEFSLRFLLEDLVGPFAESAFLHKTRELVEGRYATSFLEPLDNYVEHVMFETWLPRVFSLTSSCASCPWSSQLVYTTFYSVRRSELFTIMMDYPDSHPAVMDLKAYLMETRALQDLIDTLSKEVCVDCLAEIICALRAQVSSRLLQPGVHTDEVLLAYGCLVRGLREIDPSSVAQDIVCRPVASCLRERDDAVRCIVDRLIAPPQLSATTDTITDADTNIADAAATDQITGLQRELLLPTPLEVEPTDEMRDCDAHLVAHGNAIVASSVLGYQSHSLPFGGHQTILNWSKLAQDKFDSFFPPPYSFSLDPDECFSAEAVASEEVNEEKLVVNEDWDRWMPDPLEALHHTGPPWKRRIDLLSLLVGIYGSKKSFLVEYRNLLSQRLLRQLTFDTAAQMRHLELLKLRFGEADLQECEVMLKDIRDSRRVSALIADAVKAEGGNGTEVAAEEHNSSYFPLQAYILSGEYWPEFHREQFKLPEKLTPAFSQFTSVCNDTMKAVVGCGEEHNESIDVSVAEQEGPQDMETSSVREAASTDPQVFWSYILGMLTNLGGMTMDRIHSTLRMFALGSNDGAECTRQNLRQFLERKVRNGELVYEDNVYKLA